MAYRLPAYLHRNRHGTLYLRLSVPNDIQPLLGQREIYRSLNTASVREAADSAQTLRNAFRALFGKLRTRTMSDQQEKPPALDIERMKAYAKDKLKQHDQRDYWEAKFWDIADLRQSELKQAAEKLDIAIRSKGGGVPISTKVGKTITQVWELYKAEQIALGKQEGVKGGWKDGEDTALRDYWPPVRSFIKQVGDKDIGEVLAPDVESYQQHVLTDPEGGSARNREKHLQRAGGLFRWAKKKRIIGDDFDGLFQYPGKIEQNPYHAFDLADLKSLFESDDYKAGKFKAPSSYWLPMLALHTGARLNELCQLTVKDIGEHEGVKTISILDEDIGKRLKTTASRRIIPIHSKLIELGFIDYVASIGGGRLFPELPEDPKRPGNFGAKASEGFTSYRRKCKVGELTGRSKKVFHSFRSTLISALRKADVPKDRRTRLAGHEYEDTQDTNYTGGDVLTMFSFSTLKGDIERVKFDVAFAPYWHISGRER